MPPTIHRRWPRLALPLLLALALLVPMVSPARPAQAAFAAPIQLCSCGSPYRVTTMGNTLFFITITVNSYLQELWKSDGTAAGTVLVKVITTSNIYPSDLTVVGDTLFFTATTSITDSTAKLWKSDGTAAGTVVVKDTKDSPSNLTTLGNTLFFFTGYDGAYRLWKSDGTDAGTTSIMYFPPPGFNQNVLSEVTVVGNMIFFATVDSAHGMELWKSDGTEAGTGLVKDINPGTADSRPGQFIAFGNTLFFTADDGTHGAELWKSDGTAAGTVLVKDIFPGATGSVPSVLTVAGNTLFFRASDDSTSGGDGLWKSDGSATGTVLVKHIWFGNQVWDFHKNGPKAVGNAIFFALDADSSGYDNLWKSDGTSDGTALVTQIYPKNLTVVGNTLFFTAYDHGDALWQSDGTATGTIAVPGAGGFTSPADLTATPLGLLFTDNGQPWLLPITASLSSSNGSSGAAGSSFGFAADGFPAGAAVTISVTPPTPQGASVAAVGAAYVVGSVTADASGAVSFAVQLDGIASAGAYTITASGGSLSASSQVTVSAAAPVLTAPASTPALRGLPSVFLPMIRR